MSITLPESISIDGLGGAKSDYLVAPVDPTTDVSASDWNAAICAVAMGSRMLPRCETRFLGHATTPVFSAFEAQWKGVTPTPPSIARTSTGLFTITYPATVQDELLAIHSVNLTRAWGQAEGGATAYIVSATTSANVITVRVFLASTAALNDAAGVPIDVWAR